MLGMTKDEEIEMAKAEKEVQKELDERYKKDQEVLDSIKQKVSPTFYKLIEQEIEESEGGFNYKIVDKPIGDFQNDYNIKVWVDQHAVGDSGDSWEGTVSVELPDKKYLMWNFEM